MLNNWCAVFLWFMSAILSSVGRAVYKNFKQLFNISEDIYKSFYHIAFLEVCRAYQIMPHRLFISKKHCCNTYINLQIL